MDFNVVGYLIYLPISITLTVWVARTLSRNGRLFLSDVMNGDEKLADAVNHLLVVGFYLINLGFVVAFLKISSTVESTRNLFEELSVKLGIVLFVLGVLHLTNVFVLNKMRRRGLLRHESTPPVAPQGWLQPPAAVAGHGPVMGHRPVMGHGPATGPTDAPPSPR
ncbi:hypothetical protein [Streptomyces sp. NPDC047315]|uniref:hypothetical protein n=1 Tax=Streptomyces sp. NPDC047315 TaxID=3155142 RepID=UPI0033DACD66